MLTVIEGPDRTGKTTLCEYLQAQTGTNTQYLHFLKPEQHPLDEYIRPLLHYLPGTEDNIVVDRHYLGEVVWPKFFNRVTAMNTPARRYIELFLRSRGAHLVRATTSIAYLKTATKGEPIEGREEEALKLFAQAAETSLYQWWPYNFIRPERQKRQVFEYARMRENDVAPLHRITSRWVGDPYATVLFVGEQVGPGGKGAWDLPFVPYRATSGYYLLDQLEVTGFLSDYPIAFINALQPDGWVERVRPFIKTMQPDKVIALGTTASSVLDDLDIAHDRVPHPQYWRRFKRSAGDHAYGELIRKVYER